MYKLNKSIYGRAWHNSLKSFNNSYALSLAKWPLLIYICIIQHYSILSDICKMIFFSQEMIINSWATSLQSYITIILQKHGLFSLFPGCGITPIKDGVYLLQHKYMRQTFEKFYMEGAKPSPMYLSSWGIWKTPLILAACFKNHPQQTS